MAGLLGNLRVRLTAETEDFRRGLSSAQKNLQTFQKDISRFRNNTLANVASVGALAVALQSSLSVANDYDNAQRQLAATAKLTGINLSYLEYVSKSAQSQFKLSAISANAFTIEMSKLASKAGDVGQASAGMEAFLNIGAARGLNAQATLKAVQQAILGIDEGTDKLFSKNPSVLYAEYAKKIGTTAGKLTDQHKAQALLDAAMQDGNKVRGEYSKWLESSQGQQFLLSQGIEQTQAALGKALQPALVAIIPVFSKLAGWVQKSIQGVQMLGAKLALLPPILKMIDAVKHGNIKAFKAARQEYKLMAEAADEVVASIRSVNSEVGAAVEPVLNTNKGGGDDKAKGKKKAQKFFSGLEEEWENLRHSVKLREVELSGSDSQRLELEQQHALALLDIEAKHIQARHKLGELNARELQESLRQLDVRRQIAVATRVQMDAANQNVARERAGMDREAILLTDKLEKERILNQAALARVGLTESITQRLGVQLNLVATIYQLQRDALLKDKSLSDEQLQNELLKLDLAREREQLQLRMNAAAEEELKTFEKQKKIKQKAADRKADLRDQAIGLASSTVGSMMSGQGVDGGQLASGIGSIAGQALIPIPGLGAAVGGLVGGFIGGKLFGKDDKQGGPISYLQAIERAQRETITAIEQQTTDLLKPENRLLNLPSTFTVPRYNPMGSGGGAAVSNTYNDNRTITVEVHATTENAVDVGREVRTAFSQALNEGRRNRSWGRGSI